jgi:hypothetical protein
VKRRLTDHEYQQLGDVLLMAVAEGIWKAGLHRRDAVDGAERWRRAEVLGLRCQRSICRDELGDC